MRFMVKMAIAVVVLTGAAAHAEIASWYGEPQMTASGERFNPQAMTAAHRTLRFNTHVRVCRAGKCVVVRINDRGPAPWTHRDIDLSEAAARAIGLHTDIPATDIGVGRVQMEILP